MLLKTILNRIQLHHGFVYGTVCLVKKASRLLIEIEIKPRKGSRPLCTAGKSGTDHNKKRQQKSPNKKMRPTGSHARSLDINPIFYYA